MVCQAISKDNQTLLFSSFFIFLILVIDKTVKAHTVPYEIGIYTA